MSHATKMPVSRKTALLTHPARIRPDRWRPDQSLESPLLARIPSNASTGVRVEVDFLFVAVGLDAVSGHRDTGRTECPGDLLYARLGTIATRARALGGAKIFEPRGEPDGDSVRFHARLSTSLAWTVSITGPGGVEVARGSGAGSIVDWTWDASASPAATYSWTISAGAARPAGV